MRLLLLALLQVLVFLPFAAAAAGPAGIRPSGEADTVKLTGARKAEVMKAYGRLPLYFIKNSGQVDSRVSFYEKGLSHAAFFTDDGVVLAVARPQANAEKARTGAGAAEVLKDKKITTEALSLNFVGAGGKTSIVASEPMPGRVNYFIGNDRSRWRRNVPTFGAVTYRDVYENVDIKFYGSNRRLEHDVIVRPGGDVSRVVFAYRGIKGLKLTEAGDLEVMLEKGSLIEKKPVIYQEIGGSRVAVDGTYKLLGRKDGAYVYGFDVASYDHSKDLVIDPVLVYSTYLGGSDYDNAYAIALDGTGAVYVTGYTWSLDFPVVNPLQGTISHFTDLFVTKLSPSGSALVYSTFLGGFGYENGYAIAVDITGAVYITGDTDSTNFPLANPIQGVYGGGYSDAFVSKLDPTGSILVYSTYIGGLGYDVGNGLAVDSIGSVYVAGHTDSVDYPLVNAIPGSAGLYIDAFVTKLDPGGLAIVYSTKIGGGYDDFAYAVAVDGAGAAYVTGSTDSPDFPVLNAAQPSCNTQVAWLCADAFVAKIAPAGSSFVYSTFLGGSSSETADAIAADSTGAAYVAGYTQSTDFPTVNPFQGTYGGGYNDCFVTKVDPAGSSFLYSTYLGGSSGDAGMAIGLDNAGAFYVAGFTYSLDFPLVNAIQGAYGGGNSDAFITKFDPTGASLLYSTYLGGANDDSVYGLAVSGAGRAYLAGSTGSTDFPLVNPAQGAYGGGFYDAFVAGISDAPLPAVMLGLVPETLSLAHGATLGYYVMAGNTTTTRQCFNYWETVTLPNGSTYPSAGALFGPVRLCLNPGASQNVYLSHVVPTSAPAGTYVFNAFIGAYPLAVVDEAHFSFDVTVLGPLKTRPETTWRLIENGFAR